MNRILVVEDEAMVAKRLMRLLRELMDELSIAHPDIRYFDNIDDTEDYIQENQIDLLLLDLNLHGEDGFRLLQSMLARAFHTVVVSANHDRALEAFDYGVLDFVAKPFNKERLKKALLRWKQSNSRPEHTMRYLSVRHHGAMQVLQIENIVTIRADHQYAAIFMKDGSSFLHDKSLDALTQLLPDTFFRIHKSSIVNLTYAAHFKSLPGSRYELELQNGDVFSVGRSRVSGLRHALGQ